MQSFICSSPQLPSHPASSPFRCPRRKPFTLVESRPPTTYQASAQPRGQPRGRGRPRKTTPSQPPPSEFRSLSGDPEIDPSSSSGSANTAAQAPKKTRGRPRKKGIEGVTERGARDIRGRKEPRVSDGLTENSRNQGRKRSDITRGNVGRRVTSQKSGEESPLAPKGPYNENIGEMSDSSVIYKQGALQEMAAAMPGVGPGESETVKDRKSLGQLSQATERQKKSKGKKKTDKQASPSATSRMVKKVNNDVVKSDSSVRKESRQGQESAEKAKVVVNALDLEMGMPDEVPLVPESRVKEANKTKKSISALSRKGQKQNDESRGPKDMPASKRVDLAQRKGKTVDPSVPETPCEVDLGGGLDEAEIARIRSLAGSVDSTTPVEVSKSGIKITATARAVKPTAVQSEEEREEAVQGTFRHAEKVVAEGVEYDDGRYGICFQCGEGLVIPGVARFFCKNCGWLSRTVEIKSISPGHHD